MSLISVFLGFVLTADMYAGKSAAGPTESDGLKKD
ncbi:MAG: hypothetical protein ACI9MC_000093 [Kiritimatiellia bacterium]|jgi:hypothetical protein